MQSEKTKYQMHDVCQHEIGGGLQMQSSFWSKPQLSRTHSRGVAYSQMAPKIQFLDKLSIARNKICIQVHWILYNSIL